MLLAFNEELWCLDSMDVGQFDSRRESSRRTTHILRVPVDCLAEYLNTISLLLLRLLLSLQLQLTALPLT